MLGMHEQGRKFVTIAFQTEEHAQAHIVDAALHGAVHGFGMPGIIMLGARGVELFVALLVVGLLEQDVGADARILEHPVFFHGGGRDVHVDAADGPVLVADAVDGADAVEDVADGVHGGVLARFQGQTLMAHVLQGDDLAGHFLLGQLFADDVLVAGVVGAVDAAVDAVIGQVQRREHDDAVAVELVLDAVGQPVQGLYPVRQLTGQQDGGFPVAQAFAERGFGKDAVDEPGIAGVFRRPGKGLLHLFVIYEFFGMQGMGIIHDKPLWRAPFSDRTQGSTERNGNRPRVRWPPFRRRQDG